MPFSLRVKVGAALGLITAPALAQLPDVPPSWVAKETVSLVVQGQVKTQTVKHYYDLTFNRTRVEDNQGGLTVTMYYPHYKEMAVDPKTMECQEYCSLCDEGECDDLAPLIGVNATDAGPLFLAGKRYQIAQTRQKVFGFLTMELDSIYLDMSNTTMPLPASEQQVISPPFFPKQATMYADTEWTDFQPQTFAKEEPRFAVKGIDTCKKASHKVCNGAARQMRRVHDKAWRTYARGLAQESSEDEEVTEVQV